MTPLEEIEQAIESARNGYAPEYPEYLAALYQARAIERLEATVRAIGVQWQGDGKQYAGPSKLVKVQHRFNARTCEIPGDPWHKEVLPTCKECGLLEENHPQ